MIQVEEGKGQTSSKRGRGSGRAGRRGRGAERGAGLKEEEQAHPLYVLY